MRHRWLIFTLAVLVAAPAAAQLPGRTSGEVPRSNALEVFPLAEPEVSELNLGWHVVVASDGSGFLVVFSMRGGIFGSRLDASGAAIDSKPLLLIEDASAQVAPTLIWRGDRWVLIWSQARRDGIFGRDLHYAEISATGELLVRRSPWRMGLTMPSVAWNGESLLVVATEPIDTSRGNLLALEVGAGGGIENQFALLQNAPGAAFAAAAGGVFGVATQSRRFFVIEEGAEVRSFALPGTPSGVVGSGLHFHVPVQTTASGEVTHIVLDPTGIVVSHPIATNSVAFRVVASASRVAAFFVDGLNTASYVLDSDGQRLEIGASRENFHPEQAAATLDGEVVLIEDGEIMSSHIDGLASRAEHVGPVVVAAHDQNVQAVDAGVETYLAVWLEGEYWSDRILKGVRVGSSGEVLDVEPLEIAREPEGFQFGNASVIHGGGEFLVVWYIGRENQPPNATTDSIWMRRVRGDGSFVDATPVRIGAAAGAFLGADRPDAAWNGSEFVVVWRNISADDGGIWGASVSGSTVAVPRQLTTGMHRQPRVAWDGARHLILWLAQRTEGTCPSCDHIPSVALLPLDRFMNLIGVRIEVDDVFAEAPALTAVAPGEFVFALHVLEKEGLRWTRRIVTGGVRVHSGGVSLEGIATAFNADGEIVALEPGAGFATLFLNQAPPIAGLRKVRVGPGGAMWPPRSGLDQVADGVAIGLGGEALLAWSERTGDEAYDRALRAFGAFAEGWFDLPSPPDTPSNVEATWVDGMVEVRWDPVPGAVWYRVERTSFSPILARPEEATRGTRLRVHPPLGPFRIRVVAINAGGESEPSPPMDIATSVRRRAVGR